MSTGDLIPMLLLVLFAAAFGVGVMMYFLMRRLLRRGSGRADLAESVTARAEPNFAVSPLRAFCRRPDCWLAIRTRNMLAVQAALRLDKARSCSWSEGLGREQELFVSPPLHGWILVVGAGLPDPSDDVDKCYRFLMELSRQLGHVQLFKADPTLHHHAWARLEGGRVVRAYAWANGVIWNQGEMTKSEWSLDLRCLNYGDAPPVVAWGVNDRMAANVEKVPLLAARWSLNPAELDARLVERSRGVIGWLARDF